MTSAQRKVHYPAICAIYYNDEPDWSYMHIVSILSRCLRHVVSFRDSGLEDMRNPRRFRKRVSEATAGDLRTRGRRVRFSLILFLPLSAEDVLRLGVPHLL